MKTLRELEETVRKLDAWAGNVTSELDVLRAAVLHLVDLLPPDRRASTLAVLAGSRSGEGDETGA